MPLNLFNPHKQKRQWSRRWSKVADFVLPKETKSKDFDWQTRKGNPFHHEKKAGWRHNLKIYLFLMAFFSVLIVLLFQPFFYITDIRVTGLQRITREDFQSTINSVINYRRWFIFPGQNYFVVDLVGLKEILTNKFPLEKIIIKKTFPHGLTVMVEEKISTIIYDNSEKYYYLNNDGNIVEILRQVAEDEWQETKKITTSTNEMGEEIEKTEVVDRYHLPNHTKIVQEFGDYPIIYDKRARIGEINTQVLSLEFSANIITWFNLINKKTNILLAYFTLENDMGEGRIYARSGLEIKMYWNKGIDEQFSKLQYLLKNDFNSNINYIDLRYADRIYWQ